LPHDKTARLELGDQIDGEKDQQKDSAEQSQGGTLKAIAQDIGAETPALVIDFANERPLDFKGVRVPSYSEILGTRRNRGWTPQEMDVTLPGGAWHNKAVCR